MFPQAVRPGSWWRYTFVIAGAALHVAIFPRIELPMLAFICMTPLLLLLTEGSLKRIFGEFLLAGFLFHLGNLYWIVHVIQHYTTLSTPLAVGLLLLLCVVLSVFWAIFGALSRLLTLRSGYLTALVVAPFLWTVLEWARNHTTQFPWCFLGDSQYQQLSFAQFATFFGMYGLSWLLVGFNAALVSAIVLRRYLYFLIASAVVISATAYGYYRIDQPIQGERLKIGLVQGNIPQDIKINYDFAEEVNRKHLRLTSELMQEAKPDLILWSEASALFSIPVGGEWTEEIKQLARKNHTPLVVGSDSYTEKQVFNTAYFVNAEGEIVADYSKMYLVPFGEFVPFSKIFFFAGKVVPEISDFSPGTKHTLFPVNGGSFAIHICFEVVFPQLTRTFCRKGAALLATITNDAWFGDTAAPHQHFAMVVMRAIESRRYMVRAANTGISGIIDPYGRILQRSSLFVPAKIAGDVQWVHEQTLYTRWGDVLIYVCLVVVGIAGFSRSAQAENSAGFSPRSKT